MPVGGWEQGIYFDLHRKQNTRPNRRQSEARLALPRSEFNALKPVRVALQHGVRALDGGDADPADIVEHAASLLDLKHIAFPGNQLIQHGIDKESDEEAGD